MLIEYGLKNFLSFKEGASVSFALDANVPFAISGGKSYATIMCVKGANASGKTHLLKGLAFVANFAVKSFETSLDAEISVDSFYNSSEPTEFYVEFNQGGANYLYELKVTRQRVVEEVLYQTKKRRTKLFERRGNELLPIKRLDSLSSIKLRSNASVISTAHQHGSDALRDIYDFFEKIKFNVTESGYSDVKSLDMNTVSKIFMENPPVFNFVKTFIAKCDTGVVDITISTQVGQDGKVTYFPVFHHEIDGEKVPVYARTESSGTKQLYRLLFAYAVTLSIGGIFISDEFDILLHPHLLPKILTLFTDPAANTQNAQLLFSTHDDAVMEFCGRYRTYLVNKESNASYVYRLDEIPGDILRNDRSISVPYGDGRIGGIPRL